MSETRMNVIKSNDYWTGSETEAPKKIYPEASLAMNHRLLSPHTGGTWE